MLQITVLLLSEEPTYTRKLQSTLTFLACFQLLPHLHPPVACRVATFGACVGSVLQLPRQQVANPFHEPIWFTARRFDFAHGDP